MYRVIASMLLLAVTVSCFNWAGQAARQGVGVPRDPVTGIMLGGEPILIDPGRTGACLLLHGWTSTPADFKYLWQPLDDAGWDVYASLHAGHGTRPVDLEGVTADDLLEGARRHYAELQGRYERVVLVGFSMGGTVATILAAEENPWKLVLIAPFFRLTQRWYYVLPARWWLATQEFGRGYVDRSGASPHVNRPEGRHDRVVYGAYPTEITTALFALRRVAVKDIDPAQMRMPMLVVYSPNDEVASPSAIEGFLEAVPSAGKQALTCPRSDHYILHDYDREGAVASIVEFVGSP
jgi:carboxylesterase